MFRLLTDKCAMRLFDGWGLPGWLDPGKIITSNHDPCKVLRGKSSSWG